MGKYLFIFIVIIIILGFTNPSKDDFISWATSYIIEKTDDETVKYLSPLYVPAMIDTSTEVINSGTFTIFLTEFGDKKYITLGIAQHFILLRSDNPPDPKKF